MNRILSCAALILIFTGCGFAQQTVYFPQIADGIENGTATQWRTTIFIDNQTAVIASGSISPVNSDGTPMQAQFTDEFGIPVASNGQIPFQLGPRQTHKYTSTATNSLQVGYAVVNSNVAVAANALLSHSLTAGPGLLIAEAGEPALGPMGNQAVFVDTQFGFHEGIAIVNPSNLVQNINLTLVDSTGRIVHTTSQSLGPQGHSSLFISELFPDVVSTVGRLEVFANTPLVTLALRFSPNLSLFTTLFPFAVSQTGVIITGRLE